MPRRKTTQGKPEVDYDPDLGPDYDNLDPDFDTDTEDPMQREHDKEMARMVRAIRKKEQAALKASKPPAPAPTAPAPTDENRDTRGRLPGHYKDPQVRLREKAARDRAKMN